ncbi:MAG: hypothetical protein QM762_18525 [Chryseolinea sp.]
MKPRDRAEEKRSIPDVFDGEVKNHSKGSLISMHSGALLPAFMTIRSDGWTEMSDWFSIDLFIILVGQHSRHTVVEIR